MAASQKPDEKPSSQGKDKTDPAAGPAAEPTALAPAPAPLSPAPGPEVGVVSTAGLKGRHEPQLAGVNAELDRDELFAAARAKAPSLTREFVDQMGLDDEHLAAIARGEVPPPPTPGPLYTTDMYLTAAGFQQTPPGVPPEDVGKGTITR